MYPKKIIFFHFDIYLGLSPRYCGTLPFAFLSWFAYSFYLVRRRESFPLSPIFKNCFLQVAKLAVIFTSEIPAFMTKSSDCEYFLREIRQLGIIFPRPSILGQKQSKDSVLGTNRTFLECSGKTIYWLPH